MRPFLTIVGLVLIFQAQHCDSRKVLPKPLVRGTYDCKTGEVQFSYSLRRLDKQTYPSVGEARDALNQAGYGSLVGFEEALLKECEEKEGLRNDPLTEDRVYRPEEEAVSIIDVQGIPSRLKAPEPQGITAILTTLGNRPITVNGANAISGATILTGASIETPDQVSAVIDLGEAGVVELQPNSTIKLDFDANGNVRVKQIKGCAVVRRKANVLPDATSEIYTDQASEKTNKKRRNMGFCLLPNGGLSAAATAAATATGGASAASREIWASIMELQRKMDQIEFAVMPGQRIDRNKFEEHLKSRGITGCKQTSDMYVTCPNGRSYRLIQPIQ